MIRLGQVAVPGSATREMLTVDAGGDIVLASSNTRGVLLPSGSIADRPAPTVPILRWNTDLPGPEVVWPGTPPITTTLVPRVCLISVWDDINVSPISTSSYTTVLFNYYLTVGEGISVDTSTWTFTANKPGFLFAYLMLSGWYINWSSSSSSTTIYLDIIHNGTERRITYGSSARQRSHIWRSVGDNKRRGAVHLFDSFTVAAGDTIAFGAISDVSNWGSYQGSGFLLLLPDW